MNKFLAPSIRTITLISLSTTLGLSGWSASTAFANTSATDLVETVPLLEEARDRTPQSCNSAPTSADLTATPALMLLTPDGMGETMSTQPTFFWFSQETSAETPTLFRLYEYDETSEAYRLLTEGQMTEAQLTDAQSNPTHNESDSDSGIMALSLPSEMLTLNVGQRYLWQVEVACSGANNLVAEAEFEVVEPGDKMMTSLAAATTTAEKTNLLASEDLWYDALSMMFSAASTEEMTAVRQMLLEQVATSATEQAQLESAPVVRQDLLVIPVR